MWSIDLKPAVTGMSLVRGPCFSDDGQAVMVLAPILPTNTTLVSRQGGFSGLSAATCFIGREVRIISKSAAKLAVWFCDGDRPFWQLTFLPGRRGRLEQKFGCLGQSIKGRTFTRQQECAIKLTMVKAHDFSKDSWLQIRLWKRGRHRRQELHGNTAEPHNGSLQSGTSLIWHFSAFTCKQASEQGKCRQLINLSFSSLDAGSSRAILGIFCLRRMTAHASDGRKKKKMG